MLAPLSQTEFYSLAKAGHTRIPLVLETFADFDTPLSLYLKLANQPFSYLLESVHGGERFGRYSIIGLPSSTRIEARAHKIQVISEGKVIESVHANPLDFLQTYLARFRVPVPAGLPRFIGGLVGYLGYDCVRYIEKRLQHSQPPDTLDVPDVLLMLSETIAVIDNLSGKLFLIVYADPAHPDAYARAQATLQQSLHKLQASVAIPRAPAMEKHLNQRSEFSETAFKKAVMRAKDYITAGDIMQVVLSQRIATPFHAHPLALYRALRSLNPSPYMFYYHLGDHYVVGASPEILVRLEGEAVTVRPIAGTRPRGTTSASDLALAQELLADPKERAEHVQLMDLGRNDLGRVAMTGSVKVTDNMSIERYSHVMHIVSNVEGRLKAGLNAIDVVRATFPAGTVSGAPKVRAMEIIDELEPSRRGVYAGAVGYLGFNGDMDMAIAIRSGLIKNQMLYVQAGAGIVADSIPDNEWTETQNKARAVLHAAELATAGLDSKI